MPGGEDLEGHYLGPMGPLPEGWERSETSDGIPYYLNHGDSTTQWEHPDMVQVFQKLDAINNIKYAVYRTAMKLRMLQKITHLYLVDQHVMEQAFSELGLGYVLSSGVMRVVEVEAVLSKMFQLAKRDRPQLLDPERCSEMTLNWLLKCFDSGRTGILKVRSLKVGLAAMCTATLDEKYRFMFRQVRSGQAGLAYSSLKTLLQDLLLLPQSVSESGAFSQDGAADAVQSCWDSADSQPTDVLNLEQFLDWIKREPLCIVWLPTLHRLATAETVKHESKCGVCKSFPIVGFRYRCLKCTNVDLCQSCFWTQQTVRNHKITHPTKEYCLATTTGDDVRDFTKQMKNKITRKYRHKPPKKGFLDYPSSGRREEESLPEQSPVFANVHARVNLLASRLQELEAPTEEIDLGTELQQQPRPQPHPHQQERREVTVELHSPVTAGAPQSSEPSSVAVEVDHHMREQLESRVEELRGEKQQLQAQVLKLTELLSQAPKELPPKIVKVPVPVPVTPKTPVIDLRTQTDALAEPTLPEVARGVSSLEQWAHPFGGEEQEMEAMVAELLSAFPSQTSETMACDLGSELFIAARVIGSTLSSMVEQVAISQEVAQ